MTAPEVRDYEAPSSPPKKGLTKTLFSWRGGIWGLRATLRLPWFQGRGPLDWRDGKSRLFFFRSPTARSRSARPWHVGVRKPQGWMHGWISDDFSQT